MTHARRFGLALGLSCFFSLPALAGGPGDYKIKGFEPSGAQYSGTATLTQTGKDTWKIVWKIGRETWIGHAVGDVRVMAISYKGEGKTGAMLLAESDKNGGYNGIWAMSGDKTASAEEWTPVDR